MPGPFLPRDIPGLEHNTGPSPLDGFVAEDLHFLEIPDIINDVYRRYFCLALRQPFSNSLDADHLAAPLRRLSTVRQRHDIAVVRRCGVALV